MASIVDKHYITRAGDLSDLLNMLTNYIAAQDSLLANELITSWDAITEKDVIGWDIGRAAYLVRVGVEMKYLNSDEAWDYLEKAYQRAIRHSIHGRSSDTPISSGVVVGLLIQRSVMS